MEYEFYIWKKTRFGGRGLGRPIFRQTCTTVVNHEDMNSLLPLPTKWEAHTIYRWTPSLSNRTKGVSKFEKKAWTCPKVQHSFQYSSIFFSSSKSGKKSTSPPNELLLYRIERKIVQVQQISFSYKGNSKKCTSPSKELPLYRIDWKKIHKAIQWKVSLTCSRTDGQTDWRTNGQTFTSL